MNRRQFSKTLSASLLSYALFESLFASQAFGSTIRPITDHWAMQLNTYCADLKKGSLSPTEWQSHIEQLYQTIELEEVLAFIDFEKLTRGFQYPDLGVATKYVRFPKLEGMPERTTFVKKIFGMKKGRSIIPHAHSNMASAHLIIKGDMHLRNYDKIRQQQEHLFIVPTVDKLIGPGESSSISDDHNNVHWFVAESEHAFTFDVIMVDLDGKPYDIQNLDILAQEKVDGDLLRVPILGVEDALRKYGKEHH